MTIKPSLGTTSNEVLDAFRRIDKEYLGIAVTEAAIVGGSLRFRWQREKLGVVVGDVCIRDATNAEYDELEDSIALGQVWIYQLCPPGRSKARVTLHQATGTPLDASSQSARRQRARWTRAACKTGI